MEKKRITTPLPMGDAEEPTGKRDTFLHSFFKKGVELIEDLLRESERLQRRVGDLEEENTALRAQRASDAAQSTRSIARYVEVENDLAELANLYVAGDQLHSTLDLAKVTMHIRELLEQLVGARAHAVYFLDEEKNKLVAIAAHGIDRDRLAPVPLRAIEPPHAGARTIEQAFLMQTALFESRTTDTGIERPAACVPLLLEERAVGVIVIFALLSQKKALTALDHELFRMLGAHAATALTGALLFARNKSRLPAP